MERDNRRLQTLGRIFDLDEHAVNAVAHAEAFFERLEVNVGRPAFYRFGDEGFDVFYNGGFFVGYTRRRGNRVGCVAAFGCAENVARIYAEVFVDCPVDFVGIGEPQVDRHIYNMADVVDRVHIHGVGYGELELSAVHRDREHFVFPECLLGQEFQYFVVNTNILKRYNRNIEFFRQKLRDILELAITLFDEQIDEFGIDVRSGHSFRNELFASEFYCVCGHKCPVLH